MKPTRSVPWIFVALCLAVTVGCGGGSKSTGPSTTSGNIPASLVGLWTYQSATVNGTPTSLNTALDWELNSVLATKQFTSSGTYTYREKGAGGAQTWVDSGSISVSGQNITITLKTVNGSSVPQESDTAIWSVENNQLTLNFPNDPLGDVTLTLTK